MEGATVPEGTAPQPVRRTRHSLFFRKRTLTFCSKNRDPDLVGRCARNAQWIRPNG